MPRSRSKLTMSLLASNTYLPTSSGKPASSVKSPWRSCPNRDACFTSQFAACDRKLNVNGGIIALLIFHFSFSERSLRAGAPKDWLLRLINETFLNKHRESAQNFRFVFGIHRQIWMLPIAEDTQSLELLALDIDKLSRERFRFLADCER